MEIQKPFKNEDVAIFVHWSKDSFLEETTLSYVTELSIACKYVLFVSNSPLDPKEINKLKNMGVMYHQRDNIGFDFWGWKEGISVIEEKVKKASNLILCNSSCYLAFNSLSTLLSKMNEEADIWGITGFKDKKIPFHLQSYFLVFKKRVLTDWNVFSHFWNTLPKINNWNDAVKLGELRLTAFYSKKGFRCRALVDPATLPSSDINPSIYYPVELFLNGSPLLKKKIFTEDYGKYLHNSYGNIPSLSLNYVKENRGNYRQILRSLIKHESPTKLIFTLHLNFIIGKENIENKKRTNVAVICYVYYEDMTNYISEILNRFVGIADIVVVSPKTKLLESYQALFANSRTSIDYRFQMNRGRNEAAFFVTCKDVWQKYEYVCVLHDKKTSHAKPALLGMDFMKHCEINLCPSPDSIKEILNTFQNNPLLGLLVPPVPFFGKFIPSVLNPLGRNLTSISSLNQKVFSGTLFSSREEIDAFSAPFGGMFWARSEALISLTNSNLRIADFPKEPLKSSDGTILHAIERCYPMVARKSGFYTGRVININQISVLYDNQLYFNARMKITEKILFFVVEIIKKKLCDYPRLYEAMKFIYKKFFSL